MNHGQAPPANRRYFAGAAGQRCRTLRGASSVAFRPHYYPISQKNSPPQNRKIKKSAILLNPREQKGENLAEDRIFPEKRPHFFAAGAAPGNLSIWVGAFTGGDACRIAEKLGDP